MRLSDFFLESESFDTRIILLLSFNFNSLDKLGLEAKYNTCDNGLPRMHNGGKLNFLILQPSINSNYLGKVGAKSSSSAGEDSQRIHR